MPVTSLVTGGVGSGAFMYGRERHDMSNVFLSGGEERNGIVVVMTRSIERESSQCMSAMVVIAIE